MVRRWCRGVIVQKWCRGGADVVQRLYRLIAQRWCRGADGGAGAVGLQE
jgi:hypothetical protein